ncbi:MAG TPA: LytTR family DNA-binding domain-containing protein [Bacteroidia bacterium]|nr:LytTR family DNA-binding domain-containing protein [Bacteroidia bacterium]
MLHNEHDKIIIPLQGGLEFVSAHKIVSVHSEKNYTHFILDDGNKIKSSHNLGFFDEALAARGFIRVHESNIINPDHIKRYIKGDGGIVVMDNGKEIDVARDRKYSFLFAIALQLGSALLFTRIINHLR